MKTNGLLEGAYDIHVHASPDVIPRAMDLKQISLETETMGLAGMLIKDHCTSTVGRVSLLNRMNFGRCKFFSALALNPPAGSLNPTAVEAALKAGTDVIYFPTYGAAHHIKIWGAGKPPTAFPLPDDGFEGISILNEKTALKPEVLDILSLIAEFNGVLATGHISPEESLILLKQAKKRGVERMIVTHASAPVTAFTMAQQQAAAKLGALLEHCFFAVTPSCPGKISMDSMGVMIKAVGTEHIILSSDFGQKQNGNPVMGFLRHLEQMLQLGFSEKDIRQMVCHNPKKVLQR
ncbi:MAG: DUF6282 family protein [Desulfobacterales bacterium]